MTVEAGARPLAPGLPIGVGGAARGSILFVTPANCRFPNMAVNQRLRALIEHGPVEVWAAYPGSFPADVVAAADIRGFPLSSRMRSTTLRLSAFSLEVAIRAIKARMKGDRYRLIYTFHDTSAVAGLVLRRLGAGWVVDCLDDPGQELGNARQRAERLKVRLLSVRDAVFRRLVARSDLVTTIGWASSDPLPTLLAGHYGVQPGRILPLNQSIHISTISSLQARGPVPGPPRVLFVGFVSPLRGVDTLVEACRILRSEGVELELRLVGHLKKEDERWLHDEQRTSPGLIRYLGVLPSDATLAEMSSSTVGVLPFPDRREMAPVQAVTGIEFLALGKPIVATDLVGARALVEDGANGFLVRPGDALRMADALRRVLGSPDLARSLGNASRSKAWRFDVQEVNERLAQALSPWM
jgi:glycosyltransferase involved in cell wall biosynthesis